MTLERYEWSHFWFERTGENENRILLVGDSITNGYGGRVREHFGCKDGDRPVDTLTTSFAADNPALNKQLGLYVCDMGMKYSLIHFNNGLHGWHLSDADYEKGYRSSVEFLLKAAPCARLCLALSTPVTEPDRKSYQPINETLLRRNGIVTKIAGEYGLSTDDLYSVVNGNPDIKAEDGYHYTDRGYDLLAAAVAAFIEKQ